MQLDRLQRVVSLAVLSVAFTCAMALGCGGAPAASPSTANTPGGAGTATSGSPADRCLAVAGAKRAPRPDEPSTVSVKHVLVKYAGSKRAAATVSRSREDACLRAEEARSKLEGGSSFAQVVAMYSEEPGAASREGSIGAVQRSSHLAVPFADAAFELKPGEVSHVVETDFGFHVILRTE